MVNGEQKCTVTCLCRQGFSGDHCQYQFCGTTNIVIGGMAIGSSFFGTNTYQRAFEGKNIQQLERKITNLRIPLNAAL